MRIYSSFIYLLFLYCYPKLIIPRCSSKILIPISIKIIPPIISALFSYLIPNWFPIFTPITDNIKVTNPIKIAANTMLVCRNAKVIPTANASILVAIAKIAKTGDEEKDEQLSLEACADNEVVEANKDTSLDRLVEESQKEETEE